MPERVAIDTGPLVALLDRREAEHQRAAEFLKGCKGELVTNLAVVTEAMHLLDFAIAGPIILLKMINAGAPKLVHPEDEDLARAADLMQKYADRPMDFTDGLLVAMCERLGIDRIASMDADFGIYRLHGRKRLRNVFLEIDA